MYPKKDNNVRKKSEHITSYLLLDRGGGGKGNGTIVHVNINGRVSAGDFSDRNRLMFCIIDTELGCCGTADAWREEEVSR